MKFLVKLLLKAGVTLGVLFIAYRFLVPGMGGFQLPDFANKASESLGNVSDAVTEPEEVTVYQWTDEHGVTHFGGIPPTGQGAYETKEIRANANVLQRVKTPQEEEEEKQASQVSKVGNPYSPEGVKNLIDDAKDIQKQMDERKSATDEILNNL